MIGLTDPVLAYDFDLAMTIIHAKEQSSALEGAGQTGAALARALL